MSAAASGQLVGAGGYQVLPGASMAEHLLLSVPLVLVALVMVSSPARALHSALDSPRSWQVLADAGVTPRTFVYGRYVLIEAGKAGLILAGYLTLAVSTLVSASAEGLTWMVAVTSVACVTAAVLVRFVVVLRRPGRRIMDEQRLPWRGVGASVLLAAAVAWLVASVVGHLNAVPAASVLQVVTALIAGRPVLVAAVSVLICVVAVAALARAHVALKRAVWADVVEMTLRARTARVDAPALPSRPLAAVTAVDARRLTRSASLRLRPVANVAGLLVLTVVVAAAWVAINGVVSLPPDLPRPELAASGVAISAYLANVAAASLLAMDADRHAFTLWQLVPGGVRTVAGARSVQGAALTTAAAFLWTAAAGILLGLTPRELALCLVAGATMAVFGTVIDLLGSLRWPQLDWAEATEIGTSSPGRYAVGFVVGIPVVAVLALLRAVPFDLGTTQVVILAGVLLVLSPLLALALMRGVLVVAGSYLHA